MASTLRPGGLIDLTEYNFVIHDGHRKPIIIPDERMYEMRGPWLPRWMKLAQKAIQHRGGEVDAADHLFGWVMHHGAFRDVHHRQFWYQASPWRRENDIHSQRENEIATTMMEDMLVCGRFKLYHGAFTNPASLSRNSSNPVGRCSWEQGTLNIL